MSNKYIGYLKASRENASYTQEQASFILKVSVRTLSDYENGKTQVPRDILDKMSFVYKDKYLAYNYFVERFEVAKEYPTVDKIEFARGVLSLQSCIDEVVEHNPKLIRIAKDGVVDETEEDDWRKISKVIMELAGVAMSLGLGEYEKRPMAATTGL